MNDELDINAGDFDVDSVTDAMDVIELTMERFLDTASVDLVYGDPVEHGDTLIIPTAEILAGLGFGVGSGSGSAGKHDGEEGEEGGEGYGEGGGGGGGGRTFARPVAIVVSSPEGVRVEPVVDVTKIALGFLTAAGFMTGMILRMLSPKRMS
ncbi:MAG: spore germination protein GerW family protein [Anaerolineales bacterium]|jgi:uncharacterized spore protein YtfJ